MISQKHTAQGQFGAHLSQSRSPSVVEGVGGVLALSACEAVSDFGCVCGRGIARMPWGTGVSRHEPLPVECDQQDRCQGAGFRAGGISFRAGGAQYPGAEPTRKTGRCARSDTRRSAAEAQMYTGPGRGGRVGRALRAESERTLPGRVQPVREHRTGPARPTTPRGRWLRA